MSMKNVGDLMKRLQKMMPAHVEPAFKTGEELLAWQKEQGKLRSEALERENRAMKMQRTFNRSGIRPNTAPLCCFLQAVPTSRAETERCQIPRNL